MASGNINSYTDTTLHPTSVANALNTLDWWEAPLLKLFGFDQGNSRKLGGITHWPATKLTWLEDTLNPLSSTVGSGGIDATNSTATLPVADGTLFRQGDIILVEAEYFLVLSVSGNNLTVKVNRPYGGTLAAHAADVAISIVSRAMPENADVVLGYSTVVSEKYNYTQIIDASVSVSRTEQKVTHWTNVSDMLDYQVAKLFKNGGGMGELAKRLANIYYHGVRAQRTSTAGAYGSAGGFKTFVTTNVTDLSSASLQISDIHAMLRTIRDLNGKVTHLIAGSWVMEKLNSFWPATERVPSAKMGGQEPFDGIITPHGTVKLVYDWMCPAGELHFVNPEYIGWLPLTPFERQDASLPGVDGQRAKIVGEYTFFTSLEKTHGYIKNISTTS